MEGFSSGNAKYAVRNLALIPSWECDIACFHCVFSSSPKVKGRLPIQSGLNAIRELHDCSHLEVVTVSGGEPFIQPDYLLAVGELCTDLDLRFRVVTNASFAQDMEVATNTLKTLVASGLDQVGISWDGFHEKFIDAQLVVNAIRACRKLRISVQLTCVVTRDVTLSQALDALGDEAFELKTVQIKCLPVGRAARKVAAETLLPSSDWETGRACRSDFDTLAIVHDGTVYPCCAVGGFTDGIALGRYPDEKISSLLDKRENDFKWMALSSKGPQFLMGYATADELSACGASQSLHDCVNCNRLFKTKLGDELVERASKAVANQVQVLLQRNRSP